MKNTDRSSVYNRLRSVYFIIKQTLDCAQYCKTDLSLCKYHCFCP